MTNRLPALAFFAHSFGLRTNEQLDEMVGYLLMYNAVCRGLHASECPHQH